VVAWRVASPFGPRCIAALALVFPVLHLSYGIGVLRGLIDRVLRRGRPGARLADAPLTR